MAWEITPQGYLKTKAIVTKGCILQYYGHELGLTGSRANQLVDVYRSIDELSKSETLKSFEGMPITITHPDKKAVDAGDWKDKAVGHIQNIRVEGNYIVCDAYIQDAAAIELLENKDIRELSVGYEPADIQELGGKFYHINIRANHIAIVVEGRAGSDCRLLTDSKGKPLMKKKGVLALIDALRKKLNDTEGDLSKDEINKQIDELLARLTEVQNKEDEDSKAKAEELQKQIDELKAKLPTPTDDEPEDAKDAQIASLTAELEKVKKERDDLQARIDELETEKDKGSVMNDAKSRFPKVNLADAKTGNDVRIKVLVDSGVYTETQAKQLNDTELRAAYAGLSASMKKTNKTVSSLLNDGKGKPEAINYTKAFSSKRGEK